MNHDQRLKTMNNPTESDAAAAELAAFFKESDAIAAAAPSEQQLADAVAQLRRSERGTQALADFLALLDNGGSGLDTSNWTALKTLVESARASHYPRLLKACGR